ncbi:MAG: cytochrome c biogenesis protein CcsA [Desulfovibrionales bacterium]|nr:cytochrome c biogenesis protein CcsA [Desulfovibrionales bacterium]
MHSRWLMLLAPAAMALMTVGQYFIWIYAPEEATMGLVQKIFYFHLPLAWWAFAAFFGVFVSSILVLVTKREDWDVWAAALAEAGVLLSGLALVSGSVWGRAAWNTWWTWDPRLSTTLVMWFVYAGYLVLRAADVGGAKAARVRAVLGIVAFLDVPLVFVSARLWRSIHPSVFASKSGGLEPEMWTTVWINVLAWGVLCTALVLTRYHGMTLRHRVEAALVRMQEKTLQ